MTNYHSIEFNHTEINQNLLNISNKIRTNIFSWNGQFSPQFVEVLLNKYAEKDFNVIDPFVGSGTTLVECARKNIGAFGVELNVAPFYMAKIYELVNLNKSERVSLINSVNDFIFTQFDIGSFVNNILVEIDRDIPFYSDILSTLFVLLDIGNNELSFDFIFSLWKSLSSIILTLPFSSCGVNVVLGDSRVIPVGDNCFDLLLTSPPYINVFNYHQRYRGSVELLGFNVLDIAKSEFGSNRKFRNNRILTSIQYCVDMALSINEFIRVCKVDAPLIFIVGRESSILGYKFCNSELLYNIFHNVFNLDLFLKQERVFKNRFGKLIFEDILHFKNNGECISSRDFIVDCARGVAVDYLSNILELDGGSENISFIGDAISKSFSVDYSKFAYGSM